MVWRVFSRDGTAIWTTYKTQAREDAGYCELSLRYWPQCTASPESLLATVKTS
jgi:hypothetical protein